MATPRVVRLPVVTRVEATSNKVMTVEVMMDGVTRRRNFHDLTMHLPPVTCFALTYLFF